MSRKWVTESERAKGKKGLSRTVRKREKWERIKKKTKGRRREERHMRKLESEDRDQIVRETSDVPLLPGERLLLDETLEQRRQEQNEFDWAEPPLDPEYV